MPSHAFLLGITVLIWSVLQLAAQGVPLSSTKDTSDSSTTGLSEEDILATMKTETTDGSERTSTPMEKYDGAEDVSDTTEKGGDDSMPLCNPSVLEDDVEDVMLFDYVEEEDLACKEGKVDVIAPKLLIGEDDVVRIMEFNSSSSDRVIANNTQIRVYSVDYHYRRMLVFFVAGNTIIRAKAVSGGLVTSCQALPIDLTNSATTLAVNWVHDKLYWMTDERRAVEVSDLDGSNRDVLFDDQLDAYYPNNIVVDPYAGFIFIANNKSIIRAGLNGSDFKELTFPTLEVHSVRCIAIDRHREKLYSFGWKSDNESYLAVTDYNGERGGFLLTRSSYDENVWDDVVSIDVFRNQLILATHYSDYWNRIEVVDRHGSQIISHTTDRRELWAVKMFHPSVQQREDRRQCLNPDDD